MAIGRDDILLETSRHTVALLRKYGFDVDYRETDGGHTWVQWREYLNEFVTHLFQ
jgi:enterochelin esterase family protein